MTRICSTRRSIGSFVLVIMSLRQNISHGSVKKETYRKLYNVKNVSEWTKLCNKMLKINLCITFLLIMQHFAQVYSHISAQTKQILNKGVRKRLFQAKNHHHKWRVTISLSVISQKRISEGKKHFYLYDPPTFCTQ